MPNAGELRAQADHLREIVRTVTHPDLVAAMRELIEEYELRAREEDGA
jgi:hypothetical protein